MTRFGEEVLITPYVKKFNGVKLLIQYEIKDAVTQEFRAIGESSHCFLDSKGMPVNLKKVYPKFYEVFMQMFDKNES